METLTFSFDIAILKMTRNPVIPHLCTKTYEDPLTKILRVKNMELEDFHL